MVTEVILPVLGETMDKGKIVKWFVREGQPTEKGEPLYQVETDKAVLDVEAPVGGRRGIDGAKAVEVAVEGAAEVLLARKIAAVGNPDRVRAGAQLPADPDALDVVRDGLLPHRRIGVRQAPELVGVWLPRLILERV